MSTATVARPQEDETVDYWAEEDDGDAPSRDAGSLLDLVATHGPDPLSEDRLTFELLADELEEAMLAASSMRRVVRQPAYAEMLTLGETAIPFLLERLREPGARPLWLRLLGALTAYEPGAGQATVEEAAQAWLRWGQLRGRVDPARA